MATIGWLDSLGRAVFGEVELKETHESLGDGPGFPSGLRSVGVVYQHSYNALVKVHTTGEFARIMPQELQDRCEEFRYSIVEYDYRIELFNQMYQVANKSFNGWRIAMGLAIPEAIGDFDRLVPPLSELKVYEKHVTAAFKLSLLYVAIRDS